MLTTTIINYITDLLLKEPDTLSEFTIEHATALLMNLCLRTKGKKALLLIPEKSLKLLSELMERENIQIRTYVNGILFNMLSEAKFRDEANKYGMIEMMNYIKEIHPNELELIQQVDFVLDRLASNNSLNDEC